MVCCIATFAWGSLLSLCVASTAFAETPGHPRVNQINQRVTSQQSRITAGVARGQLGPSQAHRDAVVDVARDLRQLSRDEALHDGHVTPVEQLRLDREFGPQQHSHLRPALIITLPAGKSQDVRRPCTCGGFPRTPLLAGLTARSRGAAIAQEFAPPMPPVPDLSRLIPLSARVVLDAGCGTGDLGAAYRRLNPNARLLAIDSDPDMVAAARAHYDECDVANAQTEALPFQTPDGIDYIVYSAVLEYLPDPFAVLRRHAEALSPDGMMLIFVPNMKHWRLAERRLRGTFDGEE